MNNKDLFKEAIADAKAVREAALANAKAALEEALAPKLQSMLAAKLQEMESDDELDETKKSDEMEEGFHPETTGDLDQDRATAANQLAEYGDDELEEDFDLSEILAELSKEDELEEGKKKKDKEEIDEAKKEDLDEAEEAEDEEEDESDESDENDDKITDLTVDELKDIIKDIISAEMGENAEEMEMDAADDMDVDMDIDGGDDLSMDNEEEGEVEIADEDEEEDIDLEELLAELDSLDEADDDNIEEAKKKKEDKEEMKEALKTIETLRNELNEVNLLNAKLLYVNKIFKAKNLTESQKLKVIAQFDKAETVTEAKTIFESMNNAIEKSKKSIVKESLGFASKAAGVAPKKQIVEVNDTVARWQILAGIK